MPRESSVAVTDPTRCDRTQGTAHPHPARGSEANCPAAPVRSACRRGPSTRLAQSARGSADPGPRPTRRDRQRHGSAGRHRRPTRLRPLPARAAPRSVRSSGSPNDGPMSHSALARRAVQLAEAKRRHRRRTARPRRPGGPRCQQPRAPASSLLLAVRRACIVRCIKRCLGARTNPGSVS